KIEDYFRAGVRAVWVLYPDAAVAKVNVYASPTEVTILPLGATLDGGSVIPGFRLGVTELLGDGST
ncbi:MAG: Uma2 family endonuclease, partial [Isosphaeraceae bacterium]